MLSYFRLCESSEFYIPFHLTEGYLPSYGFMFGSVIALYLPMIADISLRGTDMGKRMGIALAPIGIASLVGPPIAGAILGPDYIWWRPIVFSAVSVFHASILFSYVSFYSRLSSWSPLDSTSLPDKPTGDGHEFNLPQSDEHPFYRRSRNTSPSNLLSTKHTLFNIVSTTLYSSLQRNIEHQ